MDYEDSRQSKFNAGVALAERIDQLQRAINAARFNPLAINQSTMTYNYEVMIEANNGLLKEAWAKLTPDEQKKGERIKALVNKYSKELPPIKINSEGRLIPNNNNFKRLMNLLDKYENFNKEFLDAHSLNSPNMDDDEGL